MMVSAMEDIIGIVFIAVIFLRIFLLRPHWLGNIISFAAIMIIMTYGEVSEFGSEPWIGMAVVSAVWVLLLHWLSKLCDKRRAKKKSKKADVQQNKAAEQKLQPPIQIQPPKPPQPPKPKQPQKPKPEPVLVEQTLNYCVRCRKPLKGPKCVHCGFDHTADSVLFLCKIEPEKLQIRLE